MVLTCRVIVVKVKGDERREALISYFPVNNISYLLSMDRIINYREKDRA